jgi:hypothetical protein
MLINYKTQNKELRSLRTTSYKKIFFLFLLGYCFVPLATQAQCAMCRASLESTGNTSQAEAVNDGIVYLMIIPYVLVALVGFTIYKMYKKKQV